MIHYFKMWRGFMRMYSGWGLHWPASAIAAARTTIHAARYHREIDAMLRGFEAIHEGQERAEHANQGER